MISYYLFFFSLVFDFKGQDEGGSAFQFVLFALTLISGTYVLLRDPHPTKLGRWSRIIGILLVIHILSTFMVALIQGVELERYIRISFPYYLLFLGYFVGKRAVYRLGIQKLTKLMVIACSVAVIFTIIYGFQIGDFSNNGIRYQVLSPMIFILVPLLAYKIFVLRQQVIFSSLILFGILVIILISATRSWLISFLGVLLLAISISKVRSFSSLIKGGIRSVIVGSILIAVLVPSLMLVMPDVMDRLNERIFIAQVVGFDITTATRVAEMDYQINAWLTDIPSFFLGLGLGAPYGFSGESMVQLINLLGYDQMQINWWTAGHNLWIYSLFTQGLLFGWILPFIILYSLYLSFRVVVQNRDIHSNLGHLAISGSKLCLLLFSSIVLSTIGTNPLAFRMLSQYIGVFFAITIAVSSPRMLSERSIFSSETKYMKRT